MVLTSASTITDAYNQYKDNLSWEGDVTKAANALAAVRFLLACRPQQIAAEAGVSITYASLKDEKAKLEAYVTARSGGVNRAAFTRARMLLH